MGIFGEQPAGSKRKAGFSASYDGFVSIESAVLRINLSGNLPALSAAAKRYKRF